MKQTRRTMPIISFIMVSSGCDRGLVAYVTNLLWRSLARALDIPRRAGESVYFISGLTLGILLIMIRVVRCLANTEHLNYTDHP